MPGRDRIGVEEEAAGDETLSAFRVAVVEDLDGDAAECKGSKDREAVAANKGNRSCIAAVARMNIRFAFFLKTFSSMIFLWCEFRTVTK